MGAFHKLIGINKVMANIEVPPWNVLTDCSLIADKYLEGWVYL